MQEIESLNEPNILQLSNLEDWLNAYVAIQSQKKVLGGGWGEAGTAAIIIEGQR